MLPDISSRLKPITFTDIDSLITKAKIIEDSLKENPDLSVNYVDFAKSEKKVHATESDTRLENALKALEEATRKLNAKNVKERTENGRPFCNFCNRVGHSEQNCYRRANDRISGRRVNEAYRNNHYIRHGNPNRPQGRINNYRTQTAPRNNTAANVNVSEPEENYALCVQNKPAKLIKVDCYVNGLKVRGVIDCGCEITLISRDLFNLFKKPLKTNDKYNTSAANDSEIIFDGLVDIKLELRHSTQGSQKCLLEAIVCPEMKKHHCLIGLDYIEKMGLIIDAANKKLSFAKPSSKKINIYAGCIYNKKALTIEPHASKIIEFDLSNKKAFLSEINSDDVDSVIRETNVIDKSLHVGSCLKEMSVLFSDTKDDNGQNEKCINRFVSVSNMSNKRIILPPGMQIASYKFGESYSLLSESKSDTFALLKKFKYDNDLQITEKQQLEKLLKNYETVFSFDGKLGKCSKFIFDIDVGNAEPIFQHPYPVTPKQRKEQLEQINAMLDDNIIEPALSPWASPVVFVPKPDGSIRFCVNYKKINLVTQAIRWPIPRSDMCLTSLAGSKFFATLDLCKGYWQIKINPKHRPITAFTTVHGQFQFKYLPFGLCNAPSFFCKIMQEVFNDVLYKGILVYLDDIICYAESFDKLMQLLEDVFQRLTNHNLMLKPSKCVIAANEVVFLGYKISDRGLEPDSNKVKAIAELPAPKKLKDVRAILGLFGFYRKFIPNFAKIASPITHLLRKNVNFKWDEKQQKTFKELKTIMTSESILAHYDQDLENEIHCDASGIGAIYLQKQKDLSLKVVSYAVDY